MKRVILMAALAAALMGCDQQDNAGTGGAGLGDEGSYGTGGSRTNDGALTDKNDSPIGRTGTDTNATRPGTRGGTGSATGQPSSDQKTGSPESSP